MYRLEELAINGGLVSQDAVHALPMKGVTLVYVNGLESQQARKANGLRRDFLGEERFHVSDGLVMLEDAEI
jgi:hypothetical protein